MDDKNHDIIIIKRHGGHEEEHHGGAWKIAFADFMTAMMAFFLVLWIINATDKNTKTIIARYFNPLKLEDLTKSNKGIRQALGDEAKEPQNEDGDLTPLQAGPPAKKPSEKKSPAPKDGDKDKMKDGVADGVKDGPKDNANFTKQAPDSAHPKAHIAESTLLEDPYDSLDKIAGKFAPTSGESEGGGVGATPPPGDADAFIDPFQPVERATAGGGGAPAPAKAASAVPPVQPTPGAQLRPQDAPAAPQPPSAEAQPRPAPDSKGPGPGPQPSPAEAKASAAPPPAAAASSAPQPPTAQAAGPAPPEAGAVLEAAKLRTELGKELRAELHAQAAPGIDVQATPEGILISLTDALSFEMFAVGSAEPQAKVVRIMEKIAQSLKSRPGEIVLRGHTDGRQYKGGTYDNWRLSEARAQMAYYMLIRGGLEEKRVERIEGFADRQLKTPDKPEAAENRRIEILLRKEKP
ncbi:MAG: MotB family protein [Roseiarcus sp.]